MKARIKETTGTWYIGQVYTTWFETDFNLHDGFYKVEKTGWKTVTDFCFTRFGAKLALKRWKKRQQIDEFEI